MQYRRLEKGEIIQKGDQVDACESYWKDKPRWVEVSNQIGELAPDSSWPANREYRRPVYPSGYEVMLEAMRRSTEPSTRSKSADAPALVVDIRNCFLSEIDVPPGQAAAVIDYLLEVIEQLRDSNYGLRCALDSTIDTNGLKISGRRVE